VTPIRPRNYLSTPCMVQLTPGVDIDHFENHWFKDSSKRIDWHKVFLRFRFGDRKEILRDGKYLI